MRDFAQLQNNVAATAAATRPEADFTKEADEGVGVVEGAGVGVGVGVAMAHCEQATLLRRQKSTPLTVVKYSTPALVHVGLFAPQHAVPQLDSELHEIVPEDGVPPPPMEAGGGRGGGGGDGGGDGGVYV